MDDVAPRPAAPDPYAAGQYPVTAVPESGYGAFGGYGGFGAQPGGYYPVYSPAPKTNGLAIASMVVSVVGAALLACYGVGGVLGAVGAILGHVARRQIRDRQESGDGMALAGIITGWIATGIGLAIVAFVVILVVVAMNSTPTYDSTFDGGFDAIRATLAAAA